MGGYPFYINDEAWAKLKPLLPLMKRGRKRINDRKIISGIVYVQRKGLEWQEAPAIYGPFKTLYTRFRRWKEKGVWDDIFKSLSANAAADDTIMIDSTTVRVQRSALGAQKKGILQQVDLAAAGRARFTSSAPAPDCPLRC